MLIIKVSVIIQAGVRRYVEFTISSDIGFARVFDFTGIVLFSIERQQMHEWFYGRLKTLSLSWLLYMWVMGCWLVPLSTNVCSHLFFQADCVFVFFSFCFYVSMQIILFVGHTLWHLLLIYQSQFYLNTCVQSYF